MLEIQDPMVARRNAILKGYAAFNEGDWDTLKTLMSDDVVWRSLEGDRFTGLDDGPESVITYLKELRNTSEAEFLGMATQGDVAITLDFTHTSRAEGDHACADEIVFDESGRIKEVRHCAAATHLHGHAGHSEAS